MCERPYVLLSVCRGTFTDLASNLAAGTIGSVLLLLCVNAMYGIDQKRKEGERGREVLYFNMELRRQTCR